MPVCLVKSCISAVKLVLSSIVQTWIGPLSVLADGVGVDPPQAAVQNATAISAVAVMCFPNALFMEPPPRLCSRFASCRPRAVTGYGTGYGEYSPGPANLSRGELGTRMSARQSARLAPGVRNFRVATARLAPNVRNRQDSAGGEDRNGDALPGRPAVRGAEDAVDIVGSGDIEGVAVGGVREGHFQDSWRGPGHSPGEAADGRADASQAGLDVIAPAQRQTRQPDMP